MDFNFELGITDNASITIDEDNKNNVMQGQGNILSVKEKEIECEVNMMLFSDVKCEMDLISNTDNSMVARANIVEIPTNKYISKDIFDVYLYNKIPLMNFDNSALISGETTDGKAFKSYLLINNITDIDKKIIDNMASAYMRFYSMQDNDQPFKVYSLENKLSKDITCENKPEKANLLGEAFPNDRIYDVDITDYIKKLYNRKIPNNGLVFENDNYVQVFSAESNTNNPELIIEWIDPNVYVNQTKVDCETDILLASTVECEVDFNDEFPKLDCEMILSIDNILNEMKLVNQVYIDNECLLKFPPDTSIVDCEMTLSNISPTRWCEADIRIFNNIECEVNLDVVDKSSTDIECDILLASTRVNEMILGYESHVDCELDFIGKGNSYTECEMTLSVLTIPCEMNLLPIASIECEVNLDVVSSSYIDSEMCLYKQDIKNVMDAQADLLLVNTIECEADLSSREMSYLECDADVRYNRDSGIDNEMMLIFPEMSIIDSEVDIRKFSYIDNEVNILIPELSSIDNEMNLMFIGVNSSMCEMTLAGDSVIDGDIVIRKKSYIDNEIELRLQKSIECDVNLLLVNSIDCEVDLLNQSYINNEMNLVLSKSINAEADLLLSSSVDCEVNLLNKSYIDCEVELRLQKSIDCEMILINKSVIENEMELRKSNDIDCETDLLLSNSVDCEILFLNENEAILDCEMELKIIEESTINCECNIISQNNVIIKIIEV